MMIETLCIKWIVDSPFSQQPIKAGKKNDFFFEEKRGKLKKLRKTLLDGT